MKMMTEIERRKKMKMSKVNPTTTNMNIWISSTSINPDRPSGPLPNTPKPTSSTKSSTKASGPSAKKVSTNWPS